jgi:hypothetical protein
LSTAEAAAERQAGHTRGRVDAQRRGEAVRLCRRVEVAEGAARLDRRAAGFRVHPNALHRREVDHEAFIADSISRDVMPAPADRDEHAFLARELNGLDHIFRPRAAGDERGPAVDHGVPDLAHFAVGRVTRKKYIPLELRPELVDLCFL